MAMKKKLSKGVTGLIAASFVFSGVSYTNSEASAASPFSDVKAGGWADKHITKLALQNILKGGTGADAGKFKPANKVTRQEAVIIALRFMGVADEVKPSDVLVFPSALVIKEDYKPYIKLAVQKNILLVDEEVTLAEKEQGKEWGSSPATREWMAKLLVRAIGKEEAAKALAGQTTTFADDASIDAALKGYVSLAVSSGLVTGVTGNKFDPKGEVTREMASTLFSRAQAHISTAYSGQVSGAITAINGNKVTLLHSDGTSKEYTLSPTASVYGYQSEQTTDIANLKLFGEAVLISNSDGTIGYVEQTSETPKVKTLEGTLLLVTGDQNKLTVSIDGDAKTVTYDPASVSVKDINGQALTIADLPANVPVKLGVDVATESKLLTLTVNKAVTNKTGTGTVEAWKPAEDTLQVKDAAGSSDIYPVADNVTITYNGAALASDQLVAGDVISYEVKMGSVTSITVTKKVVPPVTGQFNLLDTVGKTIQYRDKDGKFGVQEYADNVIVKIEGMTNVTLNDLFRNDSISMTFNDQGKVGVIEITSRSVTFLNGATVSNYLPEDMTLIVTDSTNKKVPLILTETTRYDLNGTIITQAQAAQYIIKGKKINVGYTNSNAAYVSIVSQYVGTIAENNVTAKTIKLNLDSANTVTLSYTYVPYVEIYGQTSASYLDLRVGDKVTAIMDYQTQEKVISVQVEKTQQFDLVSADVSTNKIKAKRADGVVEEWSLSGLTLPVVNEKDEPLSLSGLNQSGAKLLNVSFKGKTPIKIKAIAATYGRVVSVNASANSIDLLTPSGATVTRAFTSNPVIMRNNVIVGSLSSVQRDDRVEVRIDENDRTIVDIIPAVSKKYNNNNATTIYVQVSSLSENNNYPLHPNVYVHQGTRTLSFSELKYGDSIAIYLLRGQVVEIVKS